MAGASPRFFFRSPVTPTETYRDRHAPPFVHVLKIARFLYANDISYRSRQNDSSSKKNFMSYFRQVDDELRTEEEEIQRNFPYVDPNARESQAVATSASHNLPSSMPFDLNLSGFGLTGDVEFKNMWTLLLTALHETSPTQYALFVKAYTSIWKFCPVYCSSGMVLPLLNIDEHKLAKECKHDSRWALCVDATPLERKIMNNEKIVESDVREYLRNAQQKGSSSWSDRDVALLAIVVRDNPDWVERLLPEDLMMIMKEYFRLFFDYKREAIMPYHAWMLPNGKRKMTKRNGGSIVPV